jgi:hypothetical protein
MSEGFAYRIALAEHHEKWVLAKLRELYGSRIKHAEPFGQALFSHQLREYLRRVRTKSGAETLIRWLPDIICVGIDDRCFLVEAKSGDGWKKYGNHSVENKSLEAASKFEKEFETDVWFIFSDGRGEKASVLNSHPGKKPGHYSGNGSGTPFSLWPADKLTQRIAPTPTFLMDVSAEKSA